MEIQANNINIPQNEVDELREQLDLFKQRQDQPIMETQTNNNNIPQNEVDELREQLALFKQRLDQQEIISERLMRRSMNARISIFTKTGVIADIVVLLMMPLVFWAFSKMSVSWYLGLIVLLSVIVELAYNIICHRRIQRLFTEGNDLLTVRRGLLKFKKGERLQMLISIPLIALWALALCWQLGVFADNPTASVAAIGIRVGIGFFIGTLIVFCGYSWEMHRVNRSIREIDELSAE